MTWDEETLTLFGELKETIYLAEMKQARPLGYAEIRRCLKEGARD